MSREIQVGDTIRPKGRPIEGTVTFLSESHVRAWFEDYYGEFEGESLAFRYEEVELVPKYSVGQQAKITTAKFRDFPIGSVSTISAVQRGEYPVLIKSLHGDYSIGFKEGEFSV